MTESNFSDLQSFLKPIYDLINGIVHIVEEESLEKEKEISDSLIQQVFISTTIMHLSEQSQAKSVPKAEEVKDLMAKGEKEEVLAHFTKNITKENLLKYIEESATIVMTNYYFQVKNKLNDQKNKQISELQQKIQESL